MKTETKLIRTSEEGATAFYRYDAASKVLSYLKNKKNEAGKYEISEVTVPLEDMHLSLQTGNIKVGSEWILNTLPGDHPISAKGKDLTNMRGSCQGCCDGCENFCYAINGARQHNNSVMPSVMKNLILFREDPNRFFAELRENLDKISQKDDQVFRFHASGELESYEYLEGIMQVVSEYPNVRFYSYTKRFSWIVKYLDEHGDFPANMVWNMSQWKDNIERAGFPEEYRSKVQFFAWDDGDEPALEKTVHCPSVVKKPGQKKGHLNHEMTCRKCGLCWRGRMKGKVIACYNH